MTDDVNDRIRGILREDPVPEVRREAARALGVTAGEGSDVVESLIEALDDGNDGVCRAAALALGRIHEPRAVDALVELLSRRPELWEQATAALAGVGERQLLSRLLPLLDSDSTQVRRGALRAIAAVSRDRDTVKDAAPIFVYTDEEGHPHPLF